ncbi:MAG: T9SS type A sorting domain-containing protein [Flavobacteriales bacterium]
MRLNDALLALGLLVLPLVLNAQGEDLRALSVRPPEGGGQAMMKSTLNEHFIYQYEAQVLPLMDDFSVDRTRKRWATATDEGVSLSETIYALEVAGASTPEMMFADDTTFRFTVDLADPDAPIVTRQPLPMVQLTLRDVSAYPPVLSVVDAWPPYFIYDTLQSPPEDTLFLQSPAYVQDSLMVYSVDPDPRRYLMNNVSTPMVLWEDDDVHVNNTYGVDPPTIGVATFDGLARDGYPYNFAQYSAYGIADRLTSVPIDLSYSAADSVYLSFFVQPRGLSGDAEVQPQDSLVLELFAPSEDAWVRVWRTPYYTSDQFRQVMVPIKEARFLQEGFRMRFLNYATLSGSFDHWHLDYVRLGTDRSFSDTVIVDMAYLEPGSTLLQTYTSVPFHAFEQAPASYMAINRTLPIRNLDVNDRFITWRMQAGTTEGPLVFDPPSYGNSTSGNASSVISSGHPINSAPNNFVYDPTLSTDAAFWRVRFLAQTQPDINPYNDTATFVQELSNYYSYDDGSAEMGYSLNAPGAQLAYRFDIVGADSLRALRIYFNPQANPPPGLPPTQGSFLITVWSSLSPEVVQHQNFSFSTPEYKREGLNRFVEYPLDSTIHVAGTFWVGWTQTNAVGMNVGFDCNRNNQSRISYKVGTDWQPTAFQGSLMIRPVFVADVDPFIGIDEHSADVPMVRLVPNPSSTSFKLFLDNADAAGGMEVVDVMGRVVFRSARVQGEEVSTADWPNGPYIVRIYDRSGLPLGLARLIVQH